MSDRELLGVDGRFVDFRDFPFDPETLGGLLEAGIGGLARAAEDPRRPLAERHMAGTLLAHLGDPRIDPLNPAMVTVAGGEVAIGLPAADVDAVMQDLAGLGLKREWIVKETPRHIVTLKSYRIGRYPVTNHEYRTFLVETGEERIPDSWFLGRYPADRANHPVYGITAEDADAYARWLGGRTGRPFRLPREAEWEYAAAGPGNFQYPWGKAFLPDHANTAEAGIMTTTPVGIFPSGRSPFGCFDMAGNVEEYVADAYAPYPGGAAVEDDLVSVVGRHRVARGGSFSRFRDLARNSRRHGKFPRPIYVMGFRLAEDA
ncbi:formylglycine-generating enzyme family protein [Azospirillum thermophilum]|nr:SUMF1/EgtB/PvdO family nonheme iron enzyme [Azospirillum thermophilum]